MKSILAYETVALNEEQRALEIIDQTRLPNETRILSLTTQKEIWDAIYLLQVRGAPAIGVAAAFGIYLAALEIETDDYDIFREKFQAAMVYLDSSRPTAVNLSMAAGLWQKSRNCCVQRHRQSKQKILRFAAGLASMVLRWSSREMVF